MAVCIDRLGVQVDTSSSADALNHNAIAIADRMQAVRLATDRNTALHRRVVVEDDNEPVLRAWVWTTGGAKGQRDGN